MKETETHLIVLWSTARHKQKEILEDIQCLLRIRRVYEISWSEDRVAADFSSFYGVHLPDKSSKEKECGKGSFLCVVVEDSAPAYSYVETSRGHEKVNTNIFTLKKKYRTWTNGGHKIHTTNSVQETNHDSALMLGLNYEDLRKETDGEWDGGIIPLKRDITGVNGWESLRELFYTLNSTSNYIVLRGLENLDRADVSELHGDIDILTDNCKALALILNEPPELNKRRPHYHVLIGGERIWLDLWHVEDGYYDAGWMKRMFETRINPHGFWQLDAENAFYLHLYHTFIHKAAIAEDYFEKAERLFNALPEQPQLDSSHYYRRYDSFWPALQRWMAGNGYIFARPLDETVFYNRVLLKAGEYARFMEREYGIRDIKPFCINSGKGGYLYMSGYLDERKVFIKWGGYSNSVRREYDAGVKLHTLSPSHFARPIYYKLEGEFRFIATEYPEGATLAELLRNDSLTQEQREKLVHRLVELSDCLARSRCVHRYVKPENLIWDSEGNLKLVDLQFVVNFARYMEDASVIRNPRLLKNHGFEYSPAPFVWDDHYSIDKIITELVGPDACAVLRRPVTNRISRMKLLFFDALSTSKTPIRNAHVNVYKAHREWLEQYGTEKDLYELERDWLAQAGEDEAVYRLERSRCEKAGDEKALYVLDREWLKKCGDDKAVYLLDKAWLSGHGTAAERYQLEVEWLQKRGAHEKLYRLKRRHLISAKAPAEALYELDRSWFRRKGDAEKLYLLERERLLRLGGAEQELCELDCRRLLQQGNKSEWYCRRKQWLLRQAALRELLAFELAEEEHRRSYLRLGAWLHLRRRRQGRLRQLVLRIGRREWWLSRLSR